ncbi:hypothetical protein FH972_020392 [Carpinus fangiana]|uniref:Uncharacterized protein n=1 Tax=Carpinus fangiana TaxID=176857 RepID=A0A5N6RV90_9ROSI|nr:hypothetical protein FH972_020392 [Carpinus fangiana]
MGGRSLTSRPTGCTRSRPPQMIAADDCRPGLDHRASGGDRCEPAEQAVADVGHVPVAGDDSLAEESGESGGAPGESRGHGGPTNGAPLAKPEVCARHAFDHVDDAGARGSGLFLA